MATKHIRFSSFVTLSKPAGKKLGRILSEPQTEKQKQSIRRATGKYSLYSDKWKRQI